MIQFRVHTTYRPLTGPSLYTRWSVWATSARSAKAKVRGTLDSEHCTIEEMRVEYFDATARILARKEMYWRADDADYRIMLARTRARS